MTKTYKIIPANELEDSVDLLEETETTEKVRVRHYTKEQVEAMETNVDALLAEFNK